MIHFLDTVAVFDQIRREAEKTGSSEEELIRAWIGIQNEEHLSAWRETPVSKRIVLLPQCLRQPGCPANLYEMGYICQDCSPDCQVNKISQEALRLGYKGVYILPGGTMIQTILNRTQPEAILGISCEKEALLGGLLVNQLGLTGQAVFLLRDGCFMTVVDDDTVLDALNHIST